MNEELKTLLEKEIKTEIEGIGTLEIDCDEHGDAVEDASKLYKLRLEEIKLSADFKQKDKQLELEKLKVENEKKKLENEKKRIENEEAFKRAQLEFEQLKKDEEKKMFDDEMVLKKEQLEEDKKSRVWKGVTAGVELVVPLIAYAYLWAKGLKFEETGTITSNMNRNLLNKFKTKK